MCGSRTSCLLGSPDAAVDQKRLIGGTRRLRSPTAARQSTGCASARNVRSRWRLQPVNAMACRDRSMGVSKFSVLRSRSLSCSATASSASCGKPGSSTPFGKRCRNKPLVLSFELYCQGLCGPRNGSGYQVGSVTQTSSASSLPIPCQRPVKLGRRRAVRIRLGNGRRVRALGPRQPCVTRAVCNRVAIRPSLLPHGKSPTRCPGTARSSMSAGRSRSGTLSMIRPSSAVFCVWGLDRCIARVRRSWARSSFFSAPGEELRWTASWDTFQSALSGKVRISLAAICCENHRCSLSATRAASVGCTSSVQVCGRCAGFQAV